ncbi:MAG: hemolysin family protein [Dysgonamonadaceae bacterium]|jgi:CBS domain containing-hemolysin-like protein|nr:hemolysin family protein [Dysgonamonadaceae bacterium]
MTLNFLFILFLVFLNGFFVAAEFAIVKVRNSQIEVRKKANKIIVRAAKNVTGNLDGYLAATQVGITIASLALGWVGESVFTQIMLSFFSIFKINLSLPIVQKLAVITGFLLITIFHIVLGELAPKSLAIRKSVPVTFAVSIPMRIFYILFRPFIWLLNGLANLILRAIGIQPIHEQEDIHSEEELKIIITESHKGGIIEETEKELIHNVFNLADRRIRTLMTPSNEIKWLDIQDTPETNKKVIEENNHTVYPLCNGKIDDVIGFIHTKDLIGDNFDAKIANLKEISRPVQAVIITNKAYSVMERFQRQKAYQAIVVDEFGSVKGFVTINDILDALVGNISETDEFEYSSIKQADGSLIVDGQIPFVELLEKMGLESDNVQDKELTSSITLGGYMMDKLERVPEPGDVAQWENFTFEILVMDHNRVDKVKVIQK